MEIIFIDTSIFEANNFLEGKRIQEIYKLSERGDIKVVIPKLTYDEILSRISKNVEEANKKLMRFRDSSRVLRNASSLLSKFDPFDNSQIQEELKKRIDETFTKSNFEIIEYPTLNIEEVFKSYFEAEYLSPLIDWSVISDLKT